MERITADNCKSLMEAYHEIYSEDISEEVQISEFVSYIDSLVEEGYDFGEQTYEELYERVGAKLGQYALKNIQKYGPQVLNALKKGAKDVAKIPLKAGETAWKTGMKVLHHPVGATAATVGAYDYTQHGGSKSWTGQALSAPQKVLSGGKGNTVDATAKPNTNPKPSTPKPLKILGGQVVGYQEDLDVFDVIKGHLLDEGYADSEESALQIMANMSEEWRKSIIENGFPGTPSTPRSGDVGTEGLKLIQTPGGRRGYTNKHSRGEILPSGTVNKIMSGDLMVKGQNKSDTKTT